MKIFLLRVIFETTIGYITRCIGFALSHKLQSITLDFVTFVLKGSCSVELVFLCVLV